MSLEVRMRLLISYSIYRGEVENFGVSQKSKIRVPLALRFELKIFSFQFEPLFTIRSSERNTKYTVEISMIVISG